MQSTAKLRCHPFFFFNDTATTEIYTLSLHDALPISRDHAIGRAGDADRVTGDVVATGCAERREGEHGARSEEHTSELQSQSNLVCRLLLEKKNKTLTGCAYHHNATAGWTRTHSPR